MTPAEIRGESIKLAHLLQQTLDPDYPESLIRIHQLKMLAEIAAQLADLNRRLESVITDGSGGVEREVVVLSRRSS